MADNVVDLEAQWLKREFENTYHRARALIDEVDAEDYEAVCLFESDMEAFCDQYGREPKERLEWLAWRKDRRREEHELLLCVAQAGLTCPGLCAGVFFWTQVWTQTPRHRTIYGSIRRADGFGKYP